MSIDKINGDSIKSEIYSIAKSENAGSRSGRIEVLKKISDLGKQILDAINSKDEKLVEIEGSYDELVNEMNELQKEIDSAEDDAKNENIKVEDVNKNIAIYEAKMDRGEEFSDEDRNQLAYYYQLRDSNIYNAKYANSKLNSLTGEASGYAPMLEKYDEILNDIIETMDDYAAAGNEIKQSAHDYGRPHVADNLENKSAGGNALKRNESMWGKEVILGLGGALAMNALAVGLIGSGGAILTGAGGGTALGGITKNKTDKYIERMGFVGLGDGAGGADMTYHDNIAGGYKTEYDVKQFGIGGELRDLTAKTWSYGKTINTAGNDMKQRAENIDEKHKAKPEENNEE